jgi:drug/metabolite transporter (DMT)-like permease
MMLKAEPRRLVPTLAILATVLIWGLSFVSSRAVLTRGFPPLSLACLRFAVASLVLLPLRRKIDPGLRIPPGRLLSLALSALFGVTFYFFFETRGIQLTSASNAALIIAAIPVFTVAAEYIFYRNPVSWLQGAGILLSIAGVYLIVQRSQQAGGQNLRGNLFMLGACLCWVTYILFSRNLQREISGLSLTACQSFAGFLFLLPLALLEHRRWIAGDAVVWLNILYLGLFCSALAYFLYIYALRSLGPVLLSSYVNLIPLVGALGGVALLGEKLSGVQIAGGAVIIAGVFIVNVRKTPRPRSGAGE